MSHALILAAGVGVRARPLTLRNPKPLLRIGQKSLLARHLDRLEADGYEQAVVTCSYQSATLRLLTPLNHARRLRVVFSHEGPVPLETAGGIWRALPKLGRVPFTLLNGDVWTDFDLS